jgi:chromosome segregation ATPase
MVMSFFRRSEETGKTGVQAASPAYRQISITEQPVSLKAAAPQPYQIPEINDFEAFGSALEENQQNSQDLLASLSSLQERVSTLLGAHGQSLNETGALRAECTRISSLLDYESGARRKADQENARLAGENKDARTANTQLRTEIDAIREEFAKLQNVHGVTCEEFSIIEMRLRDAEGELAERAMQYDEASTLLKRAQQELDNRSRELSATREKLDLETTAHQLLVETSRRESTMQARDLARLTEERGHLKASLMEQEALVANLQTAVANLKQELSLVEERHKRAEVELHTLQTSSTLEIAHLTTKTEAVGSKAELVEKLLITANGRNKMTDEELQAARAEMKRLKSELAATISRAERVEDELRRARMSGTESETARRELAAYNNELTVKLREAESLRSRRDREADAMKRDLDTRIDSDRHEISQLRTSLEIAKSEIRQLRAERAILNGQLEVARGERATAAPAVFEEQESARMPAAHFSPIIEISERSLRAHDSAVAADEDPALYDRGEPPRVPPAE